LTVEHSSASQHILALNINNLLLGQRKQILNYHPLLICHL